MAGFAEEDPKVEQLESEVMLMISFSIYGSNFDENPGRTLTMKLKPINNKMMPSPPKRYFHPDNSSFLM